MPILLNSLLARLIIIDLGIAKIIVQKLTFPAIIQYFRPQLRIVGGVSTDNICIIGSIILPYCHIYYSLVLMLTKVLNLQNADKYGN